MMITIIMMLLLLLLVDVGQHKIVGKGPQKSTMSLSECTPVAFC